MMTQRSIQTSQAGMRTWRLANHSSEHPVDTNRPGHKKAFQACDYCKAKKVKCNGESPCTQCLDRGNQCSRTGRRKRNSTGSEKRDLRSNQQIARPHTNSSLHDDFSTEFLSSENKVDIDSSSQYQNERGSSAATILTHADPENTLGRIDLISGQTVSLLPESQPAERSTRQVRHAGISPTSTYDDAQEEASVCPSAELSHSEYHGPWSFFSICSKPAIAWVTEKTGVPGFMQVAENLNRYVTSKLKLDGNISHTRAPEPQPELAWECVTAYFTEAQETAFGVVNRPWFEARLKAHFVTAEPIDDAAWYALRNAIFAYGYRFAHPDQLSYGKSKDTSWLWFENALSVHSQLIFNRTSLVAVQALIVMAYYTEGIRETILQYMLITTALSLAYSKGLHRQPPSSWGMTNETVHHRSGIFWAIFCLEKAISSRSGRPSAIHDDEITCQAPSLASLDGCMNATYCTLLVQICQTSSAILRRLNSVQVVRESPEEMLRMIIELDGQLKFMKASMEPIIDLDQLIVPGNLPQSINITQALDLQFLYFGTVFNLHSSLANPWSISSLRSKGDPKLQEELRKCSWTAATAAKTAIMSTSLVRLDGTSSIPHTYYIPIHAVITLFVHTMQYLDEREMKSDLVLFDLAVGHFARVELLTGVSIHFVRDLAQFLYRAEANKTTKRPSGSGRGVSPSHLAFHDGPDLNRTGSSDVENSTLSIDKGFDFNGDMNTLWDVDMWSTWLEDVGDVQ